MVKVCVRMCKVERCVFVWERVKGCGGSGELVRFCDVV